MEFTDILFDPFVQQNHLALLVTLQISISFVLTFIFTCTHMYLDRETDRDRNADFL